MFKVKFGSQVVLKFNFEISSSSKYFNIWFAFSTITYFYTALFLNRYIDASKENKDLNIICFYAILH